MTLKERLSELSSDELKQATAVDRLVTQRACTDLKADEARTLDKEILKAKEELYGIQGEARRVKAIYEARQLIPPVDDDGGRSARPRGFSTSESTYRPDDPHSFVRDMLVTALPGQHDQDDVAHASERLRRNQAEATDVLRAEFRDVTTGQPGAGSFIPPLYMAAQWIDKARAGRPFADAVAHMPLPEQGKQMDFPRTQVSPEADVQAAEGDAVNEVDFDSETYSVNKVTIAGQNDHSLQAFDWSSPGMDEVIMRELIKSYDSKLDYQLLYGTGSSGQHRGIKTVVVSDSGNPISFSSGGADDLLAKIYESQSAISTNAPGYMANAIVLHPRRAAWIASHRDTDTPLLQQGELNLASGQQDRGFAGSMAGLGVLIDPNISTVLSTTQDDVYVVALDELILAESPLRVRVMQEVLSGTLEVRLQCFAYSAFAGGRRPKVIARISGAGLTTPSFPST